MNNIRGDVWRDCQFMVHNQVYWKVHGEVSGKVRMKVQDGVGWGWMGFGLNNDIRHLTKVTIVRKIK